MGLLFSTCGTSDDATPPGALHPFRSIPDHYETYGELQDALRRAGLESSNLIVAIDYTKSNEWSGEHSFRGKCLHALDPHELNPYQAILAPIAFMSLTVVLTVIQILGRTLEVFDDDRLIPAYGFGDITTQGSKCFPLSIAPIEGFAEVLARYNQVTPSVKLSGPTNFAPVIREAIRITRETHAYHILIIVADGQVTSEKDTTDAIVEASNYPISIVVVGVGDGPWDMMHEYDDQLPRRRFDNFQFVDFASVLKLNARNPDVGFATAALMEIPEQYKAIRRLGLL